MRVGLVVGTVLIVFLSNRITRPILELRQSAEIIGNVKQVASDMPGVATVEVELVWEPYWTPERMDPRVKAFLGF